jgi:hypothetical protein
VKGFTVDTPKAVKIFRHRTKTSKFTHNLCNQTWAGFWSYDGQDGCAVKALVHSGGIPARELVRSTR